ncbi:hypothetical protein, conserved [Eimeria necatrix]|uniref:Uncharacterized protein n=1 Tax=Eimeria necatrix TaxID=51315 RepID=U6MNL3_9EIME|nr:hypothetical protein, conserved [Eimeria necatrix]CDJ63265.1 hypothetical protein, conserved [Eimeria necatrix]
MDHIDTTTHEAELGCAEAHSQCGPAGSVNLAAEAPQRTSIVPDHVSFYNDDQNDDPEDCQETVDSPLLSTSLAGCSGNVLANMESRSASPNAVRELEEALWLAQEELAEEQRLRAEERKHYAIFHDEYLRLQEESIINSRRTTAAEVVAQASRSLARQAIEDKEYVARLLNQAQTELHCVIALVEDLMPRFKEKLCKLVEQGNTVVALLASRWPEARLRKQIEALGISDQPLARLALCHALKTKETTYVKVALQRCSDVSTSCLSSSRELLQHGRPLERPPGDPQMKQSEVVEAMEDHEGTALAGQQIRKCSSQVEGLSRERARGHRLTAGPVVVGTDATCCLQGNIRQPCHVPQGRKCPNMAGALSSRMYLRNGAAVDRRPGSKGCVPAIISPKNGNKLVCAPAIVSARPRLQAAPPRKLKPLDAAVHLTPRNLRHPLPPLPFGKGALLGAGRLAARDLNHADRSDVSLPKNNAHGEMFPWKKDTVTTPAASRRSTVRSERQSKEEHGIKHRDTQGHSSRPAFLRSSSRPSVTQSKAPSESSGLSAHFHTGTNLRATQPPPVKGATLRLNGIPSRMTYGAVLPSGKDPIKRQSVANFLKESEKLGPSGKVCEDQNRIVRNKGTHEDLSSGLQKIIMPPLPSCIQQSELTSGSVAGGYTEGSSTAAFSVAVDSEKQNNTEKCSTNNRIIETPKAAPTFLCASRSEQMAAEFRQTGASQCKNESNADASKAAASVQEEHTKREQQSIFAPRTVGTFVLQDTKHSASVHGGIFHSGAAGVPQDGASEAPLSGTTAVRQLRVAKSGQSLAPQLPFLGASHVQRASVDFSGQKNGERPSWGTWSAQQIPAFGVARGTLPVNNQRLYLGRSFKAPDGWEPRTPYEEPVRTSLPENCKSSLQMHAKNFPAQHYHSYITQCSGELPVAASTAARPPAVAPNNLPAYCIQQQLSLQQHTLHHPYIQCQPHQPVRAVPNQQSHGPSNVQLIMRHVAPGFTARQRQHTWNPTAIGCANR